LVTPQVEIAVMYPDSGWEDTFPVPDEIRWSAPNQPIELEAL
jgi:hypothetical protein